MNEHALYPLHTFITHITACMLDAKGFTNTQTPNKCTSHEKSGYRIYIFENGDIKLHKLIPGRYISCPEICSLNSMEHLQILWFGLTGEKL